MEQGLFITFEGPDGSGKTTQVHLLAAYMKELGYDVLVTREPGGPPISESIRAVILDTKNVSMADTTEALLYAASRAQHVQETIIPALRSGRVVLCDRYMDSSIAYQGFGRGLGDDVRIINEFAVQGLQPNVTFFLDVPPSIGMARIEAGGNLDRLEQADMSFHEAVYKGYQAIRTLYSDRYITVDATMSVESVAKKIREYFDSYVAFKNSKK